MQNRGVDRQRIAYVGAGSFLALVGVLGVAGLFLVAPDGGTVTEAVVPQVESKPAAPVLPVDKATRGVAATVAAAVTGESGIAPTVRERTSRICDRDVTNWVRTESARLSADGTTANVQVAGYRAGAASREYADLVNAASQCASVDTDESRDQFVGYRADPDGAIAFGALRTGDVLTVVSATSTSTDPTSTVSAALATAEETLAKRLRGVCADPSSTSDPTIAVRDPYAANYDGFRKPRTQQVHNQAPLSAAVIQAIRAQQPLPRWQAPDPRPYPEYALISTNQPATVDGEVPGPNAIPGPTVAREPAPELIDPALLRPPTDPQPTQPVGDEPQLPAFGIQQVVAMVPVRDVVGPGCGWAFANTVAPRISEQALADGERDAVVQALVEASATQAQAMVDALTWPQRRSQWLALAQIEADWQAYQLALETSSEDLDEAKEQYEESLAQWRSGLLNVLPSPSPTPTLPVSPSPSLTAPETGP